MAVHLTCSSLGEALHVCEVSSVGVVVCYRNHRYAGKVSSVEAFKQFKSLLWFSDCIGINY